jgi:hypothetical protein
MFVFVPRYRRATADGLRFRPCCNCFRGSEYPRVRGREYPGVRGSEFRVVRGSEYPGVAVLARFNPARGSRYGGNVPRVSRCRL